MSHAGWLWEETGCRAVIEELSGGRKHGFALERAVFLTVLHRLFGGGSDRAADRWREDYAVAGTDGLDLHHLYRAMAWLGEELPAKEQDGRTPFAPRCLKDVVEERLFDHRRDLLTRLDLVFMDTTSLYFEGAGGQTLGQHGYSKDHRPDLRQMILAVVIDGDGRPVCSEMWPGNTADVTTLIPVIERLRRRFAIARVCVVADRGLISAETLAELEARRLLYILGVRERTDKLVRELVLDDPAPFVPLVMSKRGKQVDYEAKAVMLAGRRYIVCRNHQEAQKDAADRISILAALERQLAKGDKALVGNTGYRRYLRTQRSVEIDDNRIIEDVAVATASMSCALIRPSMRSPSCCATASSYAWKIFSRRPNQSSTHGRFKPTQPSVAMCFVRSWPVVAVVPHRRIAHEAGPLRAGDDHDSWRGRSRLRRHLAARGEPAAQRATHGRGADRRVVAAVLPASSAPTRWRHAGGEVLPAGLADRRRGR